MNEALKAKLRAICGPLFSEAKLNEIVGVCETASREKLARALACRVAGAMTDGERGCLADAWAERCWPDFLVEAEAVLTPSPGETE